MDAGFHPFSPIRQHQRCVSTAAQAGGLGIVTHQIQSLE
jgi:hypothetical protein